MKTNTLLMVAGAGALVYWLWKNNEPKCDRAFPERMTKKCCEESGYYWAEDTRKCYVRYT